MKVTKYKQKLHLERILHEIKQVIEVAFLQIIVFFLIRQIDEEGLIFEQIFVSAIISVALILSYKYRKIKNDIFKLMYLASLIACLFQFVFVNIDRSRSFYVISWVKNYDISIIGEVLFVNEGSIQSSEFNNSLAIKDRIDEQIERGIIDMKSRNNLKLSEYGQAMYTIADTLSNLFNLNGWQRNKF